jgi:hypothetical protein
VASHVRARDAECKSGPEEPLLKHEEELADVAGFTDSEAEPYQGWSAEPTDADVPDETANMELGLSSDATLSERTLGQIVVGPATDRQAASDEGLADVWDVVVKKTFISVVPRRHILPHTASAPGCLGILGEAGRVGSRPRRHRSSRRRSRRRRVGVEQAVPGSAVPLH